VKYNYILITILCALITNFIAILSVFFVSSVRELIKESNLFLLPFTTFFLLGLGLLFFISKEKTERKLKKFLVLAGGSAVGFFICILLHNLFYGLTVLTANIFLLPYLMHFFHALFFLLAIFACPIGFLIGIAGGIFNLILW